MQKNKEKRFEPFLAFLICVSILGLVLSFVLVLYPGGAQDYFGLRKPLVGSVFGVLCLLGILASIYPHSCARVFSFDKGAKDQNASGVWEGLSLRGHHPACGGFSAHVLSVGDRVLCATCTGFSVGAAVALVGVGLFFFGPFSFGPRPLIPLALGGFGVVLGLFHSVLPGFRRGFSRFVASAFFAIGSFLILASVEDALHNTSTDLFIVLLSVLWLVTDTALSRWDHRRICAKCPSGFRSANCSHV
jgi:hypothetical protein